MSTRKNMTFPIILTIILIGIVVYLFMNLEQTQVICEKTTSFDNGVILEENIKSTMDSGKIRKMNVTKTVSLPDKYATEKYKNSIKLTLDSTLEYLDKKAKITTSDNAVKATIDVEDDEVILLDNIEFENNDDDLGIRINTNVASSESIVLSVGDKYTDGELMKKLKNNGYMCK